MGTRSHTNGRKREILVKQRDQARKMAVVLANSLFAGVPTPMLTEEGQRLLQSWGFEWPV